MVPASVTGQTVMQLADEFEADDIIIDGGNSYYRDDIARASALASKKIHYVDVGTSGGVFGLERGFCLMIGGEEKVVQHLDPIFATIAPGVDAAPRTPGRSGTPSPSEQGYLHCGPNGAGHFVKMVHNGIEYGIMAAYAEGLAVLEKADIGKQKQTSDAETAPLEHPEFYQYDLDIPEVAEVWRRGSVIASWLLDLTAHALHRSPAVGRLRRSGLRLRRRTLDGHGRDRRERPRPRHHGLAVRALQLPGRGRFRRQAALGHAQRVRRARRERAVMTTAPQHADALVFFGATGDLAYKKIFPALYSMTKRGHLGVPVVGVASSSWSVDDLRKRAHDSIEEHGGGVGDKSAFEKLSQSMSYVDGNYEDTKTYSAIKQRLTDVGSQRPAHYLADPAQLVRDGRRGPRQVERGEGRAGNRREAVRP